MSDAIVALIYLLFIVFVSCAMAGFYIRYINDHSGAETWFVQTPFSKQNYVVLTDKSVVV
jgi:hypothetical protein